MNKTVLYIAATLNGFIARMDGDISWLDPFNSMDYGYDDFYREVGAIIMGSTTYEDVLKFPEWPYKQRAVYVLTSRSFPQEAPPGVVFYNGDLKMLCEELSQKDDKPIYVVGGGKVITSFLNKQLLDELILFTMPLLLQNGIPLFEVLNNDIPLSLLSTRSYSNGVVELRYEVLKDHS